MLVNLTCPVKFSMHVYSLDNIHTTLDVDNLII
jgi:hypothetical protein